MAEAALRIGDLEIASRAAGELSRIAPDDAGPWALRAEVARRRGDREATADALEEAIRRESDPGERERLEGLLEDLAPGESDGVTESPTNRRQQFDE